MRYMIAPLLMASFAMHLAVTPACGQDQSRREQVEVLTAAYEYIHDRNFEESPVLVDVFFGPPRSADQVAQDLQVPFAKAVGGATMPNSRLKAQCDNPAAENPRCSFSGYSVVVVPARPVIRGGEATVGLTFFYNPQPAEPGSKEWTIVIHSYEVKLRRVSGQWRVTEILNEWIS